jgi:hypothetical protein
MTKYLRVEFALDDTVTATIAIEMPENGEESRNTEVTIECPPEAMPDLSLGLQVALEARQVLQALQDGVEAEHVSVAVH